MAPRSTIFRKDNIEYGYWLVFDRDGSMRMARTEPDVRRTEVKMYCSTNMPNALFSKPTLRANITVAEGEPQSFTVDVAAAGDALRGALGVDVDVKIIPAGDTDA